jgi:hypothetical protein
MPDVTPRDRVVPHMHKEATEWFDGVLDSRVDDLRAQTEAGFSPLIP